MLNISLILLSAGSSSRFAQKSKKHWLRIGDDPLWLFVVKRFESLNIFHTIIVAARPEEVEYMQSYTSHTIIAGGNSRQASMKNALDLVKSDYTLISDVARCCFSEKTIFDLIAQKNKADCIVPFLPINDTIVYQNETINREEVKIIQTPQLSKTSVLKQALNNKTEYTDDSTAILKNGGSRFFVLGDHNAKKLTYLNDLNHLTCLTPPSKDIFIGNGFDIHPFEDNKTMVLGGVLIKSSFGFKAHSDGDVAIHSLIDALLGAVGLGDIGTLFPDNDDNYKNIDSKKLLSICVDKIENFGYEIINVDLSIMAQTPRLESYKKPMKKTLASLLHISNNKVNVKATTTEELGFVGRKEGIAVSATATLKYYNWKNK